MTARSVSSSPVPFIPQQGGDAVAQEAGVLGNIIISDKNDDAALPSRTTPTTILKSPSPQITPPGHLRRISTEGGNPTGGTLEAASGIPEADVDTGITLFDKTIQFLNAQMDNFVAIVQDFNAINHAEVQGYDYQEFFQLADTCFKGCYETVVFSKDHEKLSKEQRGMLAHLFFNKIEECFGILFEKPFESRGRNERHVIKTLFYNMASFYKTLDFECDFGSHINGENPFCTSVEALKVHDSLYERSLLSIFEIVHAHYPTLLGIMTSVNLTARNQHNLETLFFEFFSHFISKATTEKFFRRITIQHVVDQTGEAVERKRQDVRFDYLNAFFSFIRLGAVFLSKLNPQNDNFLALKNLLADGYAVLVKNHEGFCRVCVEQDSLESSEVLRHDYFIQHLRVTNHPDCRKIQLKFLNYFRSLQGSNEDFLYAHYVSFQRLAFSLFANPAQFNDATINVVQVLTSLIDSLPGDIFSGEGDQKYQIALRQFLGFLCFDAADRVNEARSFKSRRDDDGASVASGGRSVHSYASASSIRSSSSSVSRQSSTSRLRMLAAREAAGVTTAITLPLEEDPSETAPAIILEETPSEAGSTTSSASATADIAKTDKAEQ